MKTHELLKILSTCRPNDDVTIRANDGTLMQIERMDVTECDFDRQIMDRPNGIPIITPAEKLFTEENALEMVNDYP